MRDELLRELRQELFADMRSELLRSKQETAMVQQENAAIRQRIEDLESASVRAPGTTSTPASPANTPLDQPAEYLVSHLIDPVINLTQLGDLLQTRRGGRSFNPIMTWMPLPRFCSLAHLCPLLGFVLMSLNTDHHEVEDVADMYLSCLGPRSRQIRFITNNRYLSQLAHLFAMTSWLLHSASSRMSSAI
jgi:hypothetical protein